MCYVNNKKFDEVPKSFANGCIHMCQSDILSHSKGKSQHEQKLFIPADFFVLLTSVSGVKFRKLIYN